MADMQVAEDQLVHPAVLQELLQALALDRSASAQGVVADLCCGVQASPSRASPPVLAETSIMAMSLRAEESCLEMQSAREGPRSSSRADLPLHSERNSWSVLPIAVEAGG